MNSVISPSPTSRAGPAIADTVDGDFLDFAGERYFVIRNVERMEPFFMSVVSAYDHWLFASSSGGLTSGRVSPETALFPYTPVDRLHDDANSAGPRTILRVGKGPDAVYWEPFNLERQGLFATSCNLYKNTLGNKLCYEEVNHDLDLVFDQKGLVVFGPWLIGQRAGNRIGKVFAEPRVEFFGEMRRERIQHLEQFHH